MLRSGTYRLEAVGGDRWGATLRVTVSGTEIRGQSEWECCPGPRIDPLAGSLVGNRIRFTRICTGQGFNQPCSQIFDGVIEDKKASGTFTMNGAPAGRWQFTIP